MNGTTHARHKLRDAAGQQLYVFVFKPNIADGEEWRVCHRLQKFPGRHQPGQIECGTRSSHGTEEDASAALVKYVAELTAKGWRPALMRRGAGKRTRLKPFPAPKNF